MFITIDSENGITASEKVSFEDGMRMLCTACLALMDGLDARVKETAESEEEYNEVHGHIYDIYNQYAGAVLDSFDSERSPHTDLTAQAILEAENAILDREVPTEETEKTEEETESPA